MENMTHNDREARWKNYRKANSDKPSARQNELKKIFELVNPSSSQCILEVGTGNGYLTLPLAKAVGNDGKVVTTDVIEKNIIDVVRKNVEGLPIIPYILHEGYRLPDAFTNEFDCVATIATLHHFDDKTKDTKDDGRKNIIRDFFRVLKPGGKVIIADPLNNTITQKYFDSIDNPEYCHPNGHPHDFFSKDALHKIIEDVGFENINIEVSYMPWKFTSEKEAKDFIHTIHNAQVSIEQSFKKAQEVLGFKQINDHFELGWELFFLSANKPK